MVNGLIANLKIAPATFESESIRQVSRDDFLVTGIVKRSGQAWEMEFMAKPRKLSETRTQLELSMKGDFNGAEFSIPLTGNAEVKGKVLMDNQKP